MIIRSNPECHVKIMDVAVPITAYSELIDAINIETADTDLKTFYISHAGNGNVHLNILCPKGDQRQWERVEGIVDRLVTKSLALGGTATGEHGIGLGKRKFMVAEHGAGLEWMKQIKTMFDPNGILNPGKIFP